MTCIVAVPSRSGVVMGADSAGVAGLDLQVRADAKVFTRGPFLMGFTSSFRMGQLLRYRLPTPLHDPAVEDHEYLATSFVDAVRECLAQGGWRKKSNEQEEGGTFLVGYRGRVYAVESDFQVAEPASGFTACGCGQMVALGALHALRDRHLGANVKVRRALQAAESFSAGVRGPFLIMESAS